MSQWMLMLAVALFVVVGLLIVQGEIGSAPSKRSAVCTSPDTDEVWERTASWDATVSLHTFAIALQAPSDAAVQDQALWKVDQGLSEISLVCAAGIIPRSPPSAVSA